MTTKHTPATPLPWQGYTSGYDLSIVARQHTLAEKVCRGIGASDAAYIVHTANAYPRLVEALREWIKLAPELMEQLPGAYEEVVRLRRNADYFLLRELGELNDNQKAELSVRYDKEPRA